jgi:branched-subunit amino acid transport protein
MSYDMLAQSMRIGHFMREALSFIFCCCLVSALLIGLALANLGLDPRLDARSWKMVLVAGVVSVVTGLAFHTYLLWRSDASRS